MSAPPDDDDPERTIVRPPSRRPGQAATMQPGHVLPPATRLRDYEISGLIGEGGFGIVYLAWDHSLQRRVAVKEYMPASLVSRVAGSSAIVVKSERHLDTFRAGLKSFVNEARLLARFDHPSLVKVYRFWEENGTAYMVMPYYEGPTLKAALTALGRPPTEDELRAWLRPLLDALAVMHAARCFHRDIAPDNILHTPGGPLLLDFGAARRVIGDMTHALTVVLKPGYAPIEQYGDVATMAQGAWTDLYALACVVYYAITGRTPMSSVERLMDDAMQPLSVLAAGRYSPAFLRAIDAALALRPQDRPQSEQAFRALLDADLPPAPAATGYSQPAAWGPDAPLQRTESLGHSTLPATLTPEIATELQGRGPDSIDPGAAAGPTGPAAPPPATGTASVRPGSSRAGWAIVGGGALLLAVGAALVYIGPNAGDAAKPAKSAPVVETAPRPPAVDATPAAAPVAAPVAAPAAAPVETTVPAVGAAPVAAPIAEPGAGPAAAPVARPAPTRPEPSAPVTTRAPREPSRDLPREPPRRETPAVRSPAADAPYAPDPRPAGARCSDILQKASLEPLTAEEAAYLRRECR